MLPKKTSLYFCGALLVGTALPVAATPNVYWHHLHSSVSQQECLDKAEVVMLAERAGRIVKDDDSVRSWSDRTTGVVECLKSDGGGLMVMVLVASDDAHEASHLQEKLEKAIPK